MKRFIKPHHQLLGSNNPAARKIVRQNIFALLLSGFVISTMTVGYAILSTNLEIGGQTKVMATTSTRISSVKVPTLPNSSCGLATYPPTWDDTSFRVDGDLPELTCSMRFNIAVTNHSDDSMYIKQIIEDSFNDPNSVEYTFSISPNTNQAIIPAQGDLEFTIDFRYKSGVSILPGQTAFLAAFHLVFEKVTPPVLTVSNAARNFEIFRGQTTFTPATLDARLSALDDVEGDITPQISKTCFKLGGQVVTCPTAWRELARGDYNITYNVSNSIGLAAAPVTMNVMLWDFVKISEGWGHSMVLSSHGLVWTWGQGANGRLGMGNTNDQTSPVFQSNLAGSLYPSNPVRRIVDISANYASSYAVDKDGNLWTWGNPQAYALGNSSSSGNVTTPTKLIVSGNPHFVKVAGFYNTGGALTNFGEVYTWGSGALGAVGTGSVSNVRVPTKIANLPPMKDIVMGRYSGGTVDENTYFWWWGINSSDYSPGITTTNNTLQVAMGEYHFAMRFPGGSVYTWGTGTYGRLCNGNTGNVTTGSYKTSITNAIYISNGVNNTAAVTSDGKAYLCGYNLYGQAQTGNTSTSVTSPSANYQFSSGITAVSVGQNTSHIILDGIDVFGYGQGANGRIGNGGTSNSTNGLKWNFTVPNIKEW